jgi:hypothetical protein
MGRFGKWLKGIQHVDGSWDGNTVEVGIDRILHETEDAVLVRMDCNEEWMRMPF